jgi:Tol biopolymer transport system component
MELWKGSDGAVVDTPAISPDGARICFGVQREGRGGLYVMASDGTGARPIAESVEARGAPSWSPDGKWIAVVASAGQATSLLKVPVGGGTPERIVDGVNAVLSDPAWSPDGKMILYSENKGSDLARLRGVTPDGQPVPVPDVEVRILGGHYRFAPDGKSLVILRGEYRRSNFWMLDLATGRLRQFTDLKPGFEMKSFDVSPDGKYLLFDRYRENADIVLIDLRAR